MTTQYIHTLTHFIYRQCQLSDILPTFNFYLVKYIYFYDLAVRFSIKCAKYYTLNIDSLHFGMTGVTDSLSNGLWLSWKFFIFEILKTEIWLLWIRVSVRKMVWLTNVNYFHLPILLMFHQKPFSISIVRRRWREKKKYTFRFNGLSIQIEFNFFFPRNYSKHSNLWMKRNRENELWFQVCQCGFFFCTSVVELLQHNRMWIK